MNNEIYRIKNLKKTYPLGRGTVNAVNGVTFTVKKGETLGLVGESGCGKSTLGKLLINLEKADEGEIVFNGEDISGYGFKKMRPLRKSIQMIFQNSADSFNPYFTVRQIISEPLDNFTKLTPLGKEEKIREMIKAVELDEEYLARYAGELSGGQRQRIGIARSLVIMPEFVVCDEAVSNLDYAVRNKIIKLLNRMKAKDNLTYLFISHDISAVNQICNRVMVMYRGEIMEILPSLSDRSNIKHPYTKALMAATLGIDPRNRTKNTILFRKDEQAIGTGCPFYHRCPESVDECGHVRPELKPCNGEEHLAACLRVYDL